MPKLAIAVSPHARKDGTRKVDIRVTHKGQTRFMSTSLVAYPDQLTRGHLIKDRNLKNKADDLVREMYQVIDAIPYYDQLVCDVDFIVK